MLKQSLCVLLSSSLSLAVFVVRIEVKVSSLFLDVKLMRSLPDAEVDRSLHGSGMPYTMTAPPKPSFRAPWRVGDAVVSRGNAG